MYQATLIQLDNYGPWTVTPEPRPEMRLQALQARLYADLAEAVGDRDGYVFYGRGDNLVAVTNGLDRTDHEALQRTVAERYPVTASVAAGVGATPAGALAAATDHLQRAGSAQSGDRREALVGEFLAAGDRDPDDVHVAHFDVEDATGTYTDAVDAYAAHATIRRGVDALSRHLYREHGALAFFVGGDNLIAVCPPLSRADYRAAVDHAATTADVAWRVGVGRGATPRDAGMDAKHALETGRDTGAPVVFAFDEHPSSARVERAADDD